MKYDFISIHEILKQHNAFNMHFFFVYIPQYTQVRNNTGDQCTLSKLSDAIKDNFHTIFVMKSIIIFPIKNIEMNRKWYW